MATQQLADTRGGLTPLGSPSIAPRLAVKKIDDNCTMIRVP
jgi:hypothetical protein